MTQNQMMIVCAIAAGVFLLFKNKADAKRIEPVSGADQGGWSYYSGGVATDQLGNWFQNGIRLDTNTASYL